MKLADTSISRPVSTFMLMVAMVVFGLIAFARLPINLLPNISYPTLTVRTDYPGTAPHEVETLVSKPIEDAVGVIPGVVRVSSISRPGRSDVVVEFAWKTDMDFAALDIRERLDTVVLPDDAAQPVLLRFDPSLDPIMRIGLTGKDSLIALRLMAEDEIKPALESLATEEGEGGGVAAVKVSGGLEEEIHVDVHEAKLSVLGIPIQQVVSRLAQENVNLTGGTLKDGEAEYLVRTLNEFKTVDEIADIVLAMSEDRPVVLKDVARVVKSYKERTVITRIDGQESVELAIYKEADSNTVSVAKLVKERLKELQKDLAARASTARMHIVSDQSRFIQQSIDEVLTTAKVGGLLAVAVLYLFLRHFGSTVIVGVSIPLSVVATFFFMYSSSVTLNIMSLGGLALGIGMLVDNSIVVLESIDRFRERGLPNADAARQGTGEVGRAVVASTLTTVCVFFPIIFVQGIAGQLFQDQALTVTCSLLVSLFVALTFIPMLSSLPIWGAVRRVGRAHHSGEGDAVGTAHPTFGYSARSIARNAFTILLLGGTIVATFAVLGRGPMRQDWVASGPTLRRALVCLWLLFIALSAALSGGTQRIMAALRGMGVTLKQKPYETFVRTAIVGLVTCAVLLVRADPDHYRSWLPERPESLSATSRWRPSVEPATLGDMAIGLAHATVDFLAKTEPAETPMGKLWRPKTLLVALWLYVFMYVGGGLLVAAVLKLVFGEIGRVMRLLLWPIVTVFNALYGSMEWAYPHIVRGALRHKAVVIAGSLLALLAAVHLFGGLGSELIPEMSQGQVNVDFNMPVGTPLSETLSASVTLERIASQDSVVDSVYTIVGTTGQTGGYASEELEHIGQLNLRLKPRAERGEEDDLMGRLRPRLARIPALKHKFSRPSLFSFATPVEVEVSGYNLIKLERVASEVARTMTNMRGLTDVKTSMEGGNPELQIHFDREKAARLGLDIASIASIIRNNVEGEVATEFSREDRKVDIRVRALPEVVQGVAALERLTVNPKAATPIPLASVAKVVATAGPNEIRRAGGDRVALISANLRGRDLKSAVTELEARLAALELPRDFDARISGQSREMSTAFSSMSFAIALAAFLVYLVMASQFESLLHPFVIMFSIPFALIGVVLALHLTHLPISVIVLIGVVMLAGIVVNNAIVLVDCINNRLREGLARHDAIVEAGRQRLRPIMMTTATTVLGLLPMALGLGEGAELRTPMAVTVIGGLLSSTVLTLIFVPTLYDIVEAVKARGVRLAGKLGLGEETAVEGAEVEP